MPCYHPIQAWRSRHANSNGNYALVFNPEPGVGTEHLTIPCGRCIGCRLERSRQWAVRCVHEASLYTDNCFLTLTYKDMPNGRTLVKSDFQKFMKRLRKRLDVKVRFFMCGEYGEVCKFCDLSEFSCRCAKFEPVLGRPHYHACLFNYDFPDKVLFSVKDSNRLYKSEMLESIWGHGHCLIGDVTFDSAAYVARYIMKKITGDPAKEHYEYFDSDTGEVIDRVPEYICMSRKPGIAHGWYEKYKGDLKKDFITINGVKMKPSRYYDKQFFLDNPDEFDIIKETRKQRAYEMDDENHSKRLKVKEFIKRKKLKLLKRNMLDAT